MDQFYFSSEHGKVYETLRILPTLLMPLGFQGSKNHVSTSWGSRPRRVDGGRAPLEIEVHAQDVNEELAREVSLGESLFLLLDEGWGER